MSARWPLGGKWKRWSVSAKRGRPRKFASSEAHRAFILNKVMPHQPPPPEVLAERDQSLWRPVTLTAWVFGDPLPGRSALDKRDSA